MVGKDKQSKSVVSLYQNQVLTLQILYKFRFATNNLIAEWRGITRRGANDTVEKL